MGLKAFWTASRGVPHLATSGRETAGLSSARVAPVSKNLACRSNANRPKPCHADRGRQVKFELDDQERRAIRRAVVERKARLIEKVGDTTQTDDARRLGSRELAAIASVLRKLHPGAPAD
jgi:hypothetical protein